jgi:hypothetical protein
MADPDCPDCPPMPPDDPVAHRYMHCVDCKHGAPCWHRDGDTPYVENPGWASFMPTDSEGRLHLDMRAAVETALLQSPDFQSQLEELYLSALDVSFERFRFDTQFFGGYQVFFTADGPERIGGPSSELELSTRDVRLRKMFAGGGELVVGLANALIWEFSGPNRHTASTILDFSLVQPLLRGAGRAKVLERLTIAERTLLSNVRQMEQFRQGFYGQIAAGLGPGSGPSRRGGLAGGSGLEGFSGVGAGGFGRLGGVSSGGARGTGAAGAGGFLGLLQTRQELRNQEINIAALRNSLASLQARFEAGGRIDFFQVELARQALYNGQSRLLTGRANYEATLDAFKIDLGLPPDIPVVVDDPLLDRFNLLDPALAETQKMAERVLNQVRDPDLEMNEETWSRLLSDTDALVAASGRHVAILRQDLQILQRNLPQRRQDLQRLASRDEVRRGEVESEPFDIQRLEERVAKAHSDFDELLQSWRSVSEQVSKVQRPSERDRLRELLIKLSLQLNDILLLQARARLDAILLVQVHIEPQQALNIASVRRLDWMNARTALVDSWRLIEFNANDLQSDLNIVFEGDIQNRGDNPLRLDANTGRLRAGIQFDAPLTRLAERNRYRQALIEYQQARRNYYTFVDEIYRGLRSTVRNIRLNQVNFELRREAVQLAISQVELARLQLEEPPKPGVEVGGTDNRVQNLVGALSELLNSQNDFLSIWVNYEVLRLSLDFQLGTMLLDSHGLWIDPGPVTGNRPTHHFPSVDALPSCVRATVGSRD